MALDPTGFYAGMRDNVALPLLQRFGFPAAILVKTGAVFNPVTGNMDAPGALVQFNCTALYGGGGRTSSGVDKSTESKTMVRITTKEVNVDATQLQIQPNPDDLFLDENGQTLEILKVSPINPGGVTVMWKLTVKY